MPSSLNKLEIMKASRAYLQQFTVKPENKLDYCVFTCLQIRYSFLLNTAVYILL